MPDLRENLLVVLNPPRLFSCRKSLPSAKHEDDLTILTVIELILVLLSLPLRSYGDYFREEESVNGAPYIRRIQEPSIAVRCNNVVMTL
jgi:hypothetical protein